MRYHEEKGDLFEKGVGKYFAHCISADFGMGKGIAVEFNKRFDMKNRLVSKYANYLAHWDSYPTGSCIFEGNTFNLITKRNYWNKPTYADLQSALNALKQLMINNNIDEICMPRIASGLDNLEWKNVKIMIINTFEDTDFTINVYYL